MADGWSTTRRTVRARDGVALAATVHEPRTAPEVGVLLVHGFPDRAAVWDAVVPLLAGQARVVTYDVRGAGASGRPPHRAGYRLPVLAADLLDVAAATCDGLPVHVVGHDWGGIQAFEVASDPALAGHIATATVVSGASLDLAGRRARRGPSGSGGLRAVAGQLRRSWYIGAFQLPWLPEAAIRRGLLHRAIRRLEPEAAPAGADPGAVADALHGIELYRANIGRVLSPRWDRVRAPVQVVVGDSDPFVSARLFDDLGAHAETAWVRVVTGGHWLPQTDPEVVAGAVRGLVTWSSGRGSTALDTHRVT